MISLYLRNLFFTILQLGIVVGLIPYLFLKEQFTEGGDFMQILGIFISFFGLIVMLACIKHFAIEGKGTLSPVDPTKQLVINGLYRYSRNPMYVVPIVETPLIDGEIAFRQHSGGHTPAPN